jgi:hypothetical protein
MIVPASAPCIHVRHEAVPLAAQTNSRLQAVEYSSNWAGYVVSNIGTSRVLDIWGKWTVPIVSSSSPRPAYSSVWIGVGGFDSSDLIQTGTGQEIDPNGNMRYYAWYETLPASVVSVFNVNPGDVMNATIQYQGSGQWHIRIHDETTSNGWDETISYSSSFSSAEWIFEALTINRRLATLPKTSDIFFYGASAYIDRKDDLGFFSPTQLLMYDSSNLYVKAQPGPLSSPDRFAVTYTWDLPQVPPVFLNCSINPASITPGNDFQAQYSIYNPNSANISVGLGAGIRKTGTSNNISDPSDQVIVSISPGSGLYRRPFHLPANASQGSYDFILNLWYGTPGQGSEYTTSGWSADSLQVSSSNNPPTNNPPSLSSGYVSPSSGDTSTVFSYYASYSDPEGGSPTVNRVWIDGGQHDMALYNGSASSGAYRYQTTLSAGNNHDYYFEFNDGVNTVLLPSSGSSSGPTVSSPSIPGNTLAMIDSFTVDKPSPQQAGSSITFTCTANGPSVGGVIQYRFWRLRAGGWSVVQDWSSSNAFTWNTTSADVGDYQFVVWVRDGYRADVNSRDDLSFWNVYGKSQTLGSTYTIQSGASNIKPSSSSARPCVIVTATYGSELAPEVAYMRRVRDEMIGSNHIGRILVNGWDTFYYSWSPTLAGWIASSNDLQATFRILLLPLVGTIHATAIIYDAVASINPTSASVIAFLFAAFSSTTLYILSPLFALRVIVRKLCRSKLAILLRRNQSLLRPYSGTFAQAFRYARWRCRT